MLIPVSVVNQTAGQDFSSPANVADLLQWYAADQETGRSDGDDIATVVDRSGNGSNLTGATGPDWRNAANGIGGVPAYQFSSGREVAGASRILPLTELTIFIVLSGGGGLSDRPFGVENDANGNNGLGMFILNGQWIWLIRDSGNTRDIGTGVLSTAVHTLRLGAGGGDVLQSYLGNANGSATQYSDAGQVFRLGSSGNGNSDFTGKISEFISYSRKLGNDEWYGLFSHLRTKYGI